jgi:uncharacterized protein DUF6338
MAEGGGAGILTPSTIGVFAACVVPGYVGMLAYRLRQPGDGVGLKDGLLEAVSFGIVNFLLTWPLIRYVVDSVDFSTFRDYLLVWIGGIFEALVLPAILALVLDRTLNWLERREWILGRPKSGWDAFFLTKQPAKVLVHLKDGALLGGQVGRDSYACLYPDSGNIYIEKTWKVSEDGKFEAVIADSLGAILRPDDYDFVELFLPDPNNPEPAEPGT